MAKILISPLGTGTYSLDNRDKREYRIAKYKFHNNDKEYNTSFISAALSEHLKVDKIFMIGTNKSMWEEVYRYFGEVDNYPELEETYFNLAYKIGSDLKEGDLKCVSEKIDQYLKKINPNSSGGSICKLINYGINEDQLKENFSIFMEIEKQVQPGDEVYLDITHSFRSIPLFMYLMLDFIQNLRKDDKISLSGIYYGMLDVIRELKYAPVVDLKPLFNITQWTRGIYDFINYGNVDYLAGLLEESEIKESMVNISKLTNLNYIKELRQQVDKLRSFIERDEESELSWMFPYLKPKLIDFVNYFKGCSNDAEFQFRLAKWFFDHKRFANGYICLAEAMVTSITYVYRKTNSKINYTNKNDRDRIKDLLKKLKYDQNDEYNQMGNLYDEVRNIRNNIAHAGFLNNENFEEQIHNISKFVNKAEKLFFNQSMHKKLYSLPNIYRFEELKK